MGIRSFRNLGDICRQAPVREVYRTFSIDEARRQYGSRSKRKVYYICEGANRTMVFGIDGTTDMLRVPNQLYESLGCPTEDKEISLRRLFDTDRSIKNNG